MATTAPVERPPPATPAPHLDMQQRPSQTGSRGSGRGRGRGGARRGQSARSALVALRPSSVHPSPNSSSTNVSSSEDQGQQASQRTLQAQRRASRQGGGAPRGRAQQVKQQAGPRPVHQFQGSLTTADDESSAAQTRLQPDAASFVPGQSYDASTAGTKPRRKEQQQQHQPRQRRMSKSSAPDIATRIHDDIDNFQYECPICTSEVIRKSRIWSCHTCWTVFHLSCIKQWAANAERTDSTPSNGQPSAPRQWRCPGCNLPQDNKPSLYTCWCGKDSEAKSITGLPPHSCGQTCGRMRSLPKKCPHPCELMCHAGPCPPCTHVGPKQSCYCGKESSQKKCTETKYEEGWSCGKICGDVMPCGEHRCERECHQGLCGACEVRLDARCFCGREQKAILCADRDYDQPCGRTELVDGGGQMQETWTGMFQCAGICERPFACGKHKCQKPCHGEEQGLKQCPRSPELVTHCPCGKTALTEISEEARVTCEDAIPRCDKLCLKALGCGHPCQQSCHVGPCPPCLEKIDIKCRCGRVTSRSVCHQGQIEPPSCPRVCHTTLNCGRHECGERCCSGERRALERQANRRKLRPLGTTPRPAEDGFEAEHICTRVCGRTLKCGNHTCQELCHKGPCGACLEAVFDDISCDCGRTTLQPPLPCGTQPPPCRYQCERPKACGHAQVAHNCHQDEEQCPKCPFLVEKSCVCGKKTLKNQQCWFEDVKCGEICGRKLKCGSHTCRRTCHKPGECEDAGVKCQQACGKPKRACDHPCEEQCHAPYPCKEDKPCPHKVMVTCPCQHKKREMRCSASKTAEGNATKSLDCDDECARLERNRKLAVALNIDRDHTDEHVPYSPDTLKLFSEHPKWAQEQEREFRVFADSEAEKRLRFKPMTPSQRSFLHAIADDFGLDSESMDPEPHRHVVVYKTPRFVSAPNKTLRDCVRIRQSQRAAAAAAAAVASAESLGKSKSSTIRPTYNGFLLDSPRFALTVDELEAELASVQGPQSRLAFNIQFLSIGDVALKCSRPLDGEKAVDAALREIKNPLARAFNAHGLGSLQLARFDDSLNVVVRESDSTSEGGWSQVAAKAAAPRRPPPTSNVDVRQSSFTVLGGAGIAKKSKPPKKKAEQQSAAAVVDDWEAAELEVEAQEARSSGVDEASVPAPSAVAAALQDGETVAAVVERAQDAAAAVTLGEPGAPAAQEPGAADATASSHIAADVTTE